mgnify:FL=1
MLKIHVLPLGDYQTNCYIVHEENSTDCLIIDPGYEPEIISSYLEEKSLTPEAILLTHCHFDHVGAVKDLAAQYDCKVFLDKKELAMPPMLTNGPLYYTDSYADSDKLTLAGIPIQVLETPGHTPGSVCLIMEDTLFSGDTLFAGSCGRTDLPCGDARAMRDSLRRLAALSENYRVCPGHGPSSTLNREKKTNPYL